MYQRINRRTEVASKGFGFSHCRVFYFLFLGFISFILIACQLQSDPIAGVADESHDYIVVFRDTKIQSLTNQMGGSFRKSEVVKSMAVDLDRDYKIGSAKKLFSVVLSGMALRLNSEQVAGLRSDGRVAYVELDGRVYASATQTNPPWGLDRLDQVQLPLNAKYSTPSAVGTRQVRVYVIDTGVLTTHNEFEGRASHGYDFVDNDTDATDCNGHGTHVAGTIAGKNYGVAKSAKIVGVRVLDCSGSGSFSGVIAGIEWVTQNHSGPSVANMSLGGGASQAIDDAVAASIQSGVTYVVAAGNENTSACSKSPARTPEAITVGATTRADARSSFSNTGNCVDVFAPGSDILSAWYTSNTAKNTISGTSMASPHVAGVAAMYLAGRPQASPQQVASAIVAGASLNLISGAGSGSPNRLANIGFLSSPNEPTEPPGGGPSDPPVDPPGGGQPPEDEVIDLTNHQVVSNLKGEKGSLKFFRIRLAGANKKITVKMSGGVGDADLYVRATQKPNVDTYECRPYTNGNNEDCGHESPKVGEWFVMVRGYTAYSSLSLQVDVEPIENDLVCLACNLYRGELSENGTSVYAPSSTPYEAGVGLHVYDLEGPAGTDFDMYLLYWNGSSWIEVARAISSTSKEKIEYSGRSGFYLIRVHSYSGIGSFQLRRDYPAH